MTRSHHHGAKVPSLDPKSTHVLNTMKVRFCTQWLCSEFSRIPSTQDVTDAIVTHVVEALDRRNDALVELYAE